MKRKSGMIFIVIFLSLAGCKNSNPSALDINSALIESAKTGDTAKVKSLLARGADLEAKDDQGRTALMIAVDAGYIETVRALLSSSVNSNTLDSAGGALLVEKARSGNTRDVEVLLTAGINPDSGASRGQALMEATKGGHIDTVKTLLAHGANGSSLLISKAGSGDVKSIQVLLAAGLNPNSTSRSTTALIESVKGGHLDIIRLLLGKGAQINAKGEFGQTALIEAAVEGHTEIIKSLLAKGAQVNLKDSFGDTALLKAVESSRLDSVTILLKHRANVADKDKSGMTALMKAAESGLSEILKVLLSSNAEVEAEDSRGRTALMLAMRNHHEETAEILVGNGADPIRVAAKEALAVQQRSKNEWREVTVWVIDGDFYESDGHGSIIVNLVKKHFNGEVLTYDVGDYNKETLSGRKVAEALESIWYWALDNPRTRIVLNLSWGTDEYSPSREEYFDKLTNHGFVVVAAVGNEGMPTCVYPAGYKSVIAVASVESDDRGYKRTSYSNYGPCVDIAVTDNTEALLRALVEVIKTLPEDEIRRIAMKLEQMRIKTGTSFATAHATGEIAKLLSSMPSLSSRYVIMNLSHDYRSIRGLPSSVRVLDVDKAQP